MKVIKYLIVEIFAVVSTAAIVACSDDSDSNDNGSETGSTRSSEFYYSVALNDEILSIADVTINYIGTDGVEKSEKVDSALWSKTFTADKFDVSVGVAVSMALRSGVALSNDSYLLKYIISTMVKSTKDGAIKEIKSGSIDQGGEVDAANVEQALKNADCCISMKVDENGGVDKTELSWKANGTEENTNIPLTGLFKIIDVGKIGEGTYTVEKGTPTYITGEAQLLGSQFIRILVKDGGEIMLDNAKFSDIHCEGNATIHLKGNNRLDGHPDTQGAGIYYVGDITIDGGGRLVATGGPWSAGIGCTDGECGNITISGCTIEAYGGEHGAGIGCGYMGECGNITITNSTVKAVGGEPGYANHGGAGIGGGGTEGKIGIITISGSTVEAHASGTAQDIGIGGGYDYASVGHTCDYTCNGIVIKKSTINGNWIEESITEKFKVDF